MTDSITSYRAVSTHGALESVDFSTVGGQRFAFFQLYDPAALDALKRTIAAPPLNQTLVAVTSVAGKPMVISRGEAAPAAILETLKTHGENFTQISSKQPFMDAWKARSILGFGGQSLQLISSFLRPTGKIDTSVMVFAASNLAANTINLVYDHGTQVEDTHQLRYLKQQLNRDLSPHLKQGEATLSVNDHRAALRPADHDPKPLDEAKSFLKHHSVAVGELGLRYLGAIGLAFPARWWKDALATKTLPRMDPSRLRVYTGLSSIMGKTIAATSKIPDPYNPKPRSWMDEIREKYTFLAGGFVEVSSFSVLAYDAFFNTSGKNEHRGIKINGKLHRDWLGGIGASMFVLGYIVRSWAKYGERQVDMKELYAHASDTLAATAPEKIPQLLANTSASLAEHFKDKPQLNFATIYSNLANDLARYHAHVAAADVAKAPPAMAEAPVQAPVMKDERPRPQIDTTQAELITPARQNTVAMQ